MLRPGRRFQGLLLLPATSHGVSQGKPAPCGSSLAARLIHHAASHAGLSCGVMNEASRQEVRQGAGLPCETPWDVAGNGDHP